ncbi:MULTISPECIES: hypothetical protein [unclassified Streptomyces]|uniref:hypothetical protein n=1 Tax=unclassified Streptomyces TaxID=2593676 RepID=UPI002ED50487|nr:hypothetical protein OH827_28500 [Streptomyces sp. NBC_00891]WSY08723.1 hypothetical protein OG464_28500 [Streptomyces sp. NBC_00890]WSZ10346.1 hypothetical protein OG704_28505 [Streptomyces sp. NBC_00869]WSZ22151.1 hypothetical protein OG498_05065 [Streptomyces sp. NBC_00870]
MLRRKMCAALATLVLGAGGVAVTTGAPASAAAHACDPTKLSALSLTNGRADAEYKGDIRSDRDGGSVPEGAMILDVFARANPRMPDETDITLTAEGVPYVHEWLKYVPAEGNYTTRYGSGGLNLKFTPQCKKNGSTVTGGRLDIIRTHYGRVVATSWADLKRTT